MIDCDAITECIDHRRTFKIGARGICVTFFYSPIFGRWGISLPRSNTIIQPSEIAVVDDADCYTLEMLHDDDLIGEIDLRTYTKLTVMK